MSGDNRTRPWAAIHRDYKLTDAEVADAVSEGLNVYAANY